MAPEHPAQTNSGALPTIVTIIWRSWDFDPDRAGRRAVEKHAEALRRLADG